MMPIRRGDGTGLSVPGFSEVRTGDGTVLWSAGADIPDGLVDNFETQQYEDQGNTLSDFYSGDLGIASRQQTTVQDGSYALRMNGKGTITSTSGLNRYPQAGESFEYRTQIDSGNLSWFYFGYSSGNFYNVLIDDRSAQKNLKLQKDTTTDLATDSSFSPPGGEWLRVQVDWGSGGTITVTADDQSGTQISQISGSDSDYSSGGIAWRSDGDFYFDNCRVL